MDANELLNTWTLNAEQRAAVEHTEGALRIIAGPGSGKTRVLTHRIAYILRSMLASPQTIIAVTFTRKAAGEMKERVSRLLPDVNIDDLTISTFHGLAYRIVKAEAENLGFNPARLRVCQPHYGRQLIRKAMSMAGLHSSWDAETVMGQIERAKGKLLSPEAFVQLPGDFFEESIARAYRKYQNLLKERDLVDFGDLIRLAVQVLVENEEAHAFYQELARYVLVDEFQDTSLGQYTLLKQLAGKHGNLAVIGDPMQSIYGWRQADPASVMAQFEADFPEMSEIVLRQSYRFTETILKASEAVVAALGEPPRRLKTDNGAGGKIKIIKAESDRDEALLLVEKIKRLFEQGEITYNDCAILTRTGGQRRLLEQAFLRANMPYKLVGDRPFFERQEIRVMLGYLRLAADPFDAGALARVINTPPRGLGRKTQEKIRGEDFQLTTESLLSADMHADLSAKAKAGAAEILEIINDISGAVEGHSLPALFDFVLEHSGYLTWLLDGQSDESDLGSEAGLEELRRMTLKYANLADFLSAVEDLTDDLSAQDEGVSLATLHAVKGLEFPVVFIAGLEEGLFPHVKSSESQATLDEEYRLFYVGLTRAKHKLYLSYARYREQNGVVREASPSRLLRALPKELVERS